MLQLQKALFPWITLLAYTAFLILVQCTSKSANYKMSLCDCLKGLISETTGKGLAICWESIHGRGYCLTDKTDPSQLLILIKINPHELSISLQVNSST